MRPRTPRFTTFKTARAKLASLNKKLEPFANQRIDMDDPNALEALRNSSPLDETGIRAEAEAVLSIILETYATSDAKARDSIRKLVARNRAFVWATGVPMPPTTDQGFRQHLLWISVIDHAQDPRDTALTMKDLLERAEAARVDIKKVLLEVADLSSDVALTAMGSLKSIFQRIAQAKN